MRVDGSAATYTRTTLSGRTHADTLVTETRSFNGQVVLVHGDTHFFKIDKPLVNQPNLVANLTRVETFGSPNIHWIRVTVDPRSRNVFTIEPMIVPGN